MIRRPPRSTLSSSSAASDVYKRQITGGAVAVVWLWIPLTILVVGISSIPSVVGFALAAVVFVYLMRGVEWLERIRSEAVFGMGITVPPRTLSPYTGFQRWLHQLWLDISSA